MRKLLLITFAISIAYNTNTSAVTEDNLKIHFSSEVNSIITVKLAYYYGSKVFLQDSISIEPHGELSYTGPFHKGIYLLVFPDSGVYEFMINNMYEHSINIFPEKNSYSCTIQGDSISIAFDVYSKTMTKIVKCIDSLRNEISGIDKVETKKYLKESIRHCKDSLQFVKEYYANIYKGTFLGNYIQAQLPVLMPVSYKNEAGVYDSLNWLLKLHYYKNHYLDNIDWDDSRLIYTPVMEEKINDYLEKIAKHEARSQSEAIDTILHRVKNQEVTKFLTEMLLKRFGKLKHKAIEEYAYLYLIKNYYLEGKTPWINDEQSILFQNEYDDLLPGSSGQKAPDISLPDKNDHLINLYDIHSEYLLVFFWNYECKYCKRILQELASLVSKYGYQDIKVLTVFTGEDLDIWKAYLARKIPKSWYNTYQTGQKIKPANTYNVSNIPSIFLLNSNKLILNKNVTVSELDNYFYKSATDKIIKDD